MTATDHAGAAKPSGHKQLLLLLGAGDAHLHVLASLARHAAVTPNADQSFQTGSPTLLDAVVKPCRIKNLPGGIEKPGTGSCEIFDPNICGLQCFEVFGLVQAFK